MARGLMPPACGLGVADPRVAYPAFPGEVVQGVPKRIAEFRAGRVAARLALAELGLPDRPIPAAPDRAPIWPQGLQGSISHSDSLCLAVVGRCRGIGADLEEATPLDDALRESVLRPEEAGASALEAKLIFSAKEAAYKAQYPLSRQLFDFHMLSVTLDGPGFTARFTAEVPPFPAGRVLRGRWGAGAGHFLTLVTL